MNPTNIIYVLINMYKQDEINSELIKNKDTKRPMSPSIVSGQAETNREEDTEIEKDI